MSQKGAGHKDQENEELKQITRESDKLKRSYREAEEEIARLKKELEKAQGKPDTTGDDRMQTPDDIKGDSTGCDQALYGIVCPGQNEQHTTPTNPGMYQMYCVDTTNTYDDEVKQGSSETPKKSRFVYHIDEIEMGQTLGSGEFATTQVGVIKASNQAVAVKVLKDGIDANDYKNEMRNLLNVGGHPNVMRFLGIMPMGGNQCFLTEFCELGSLDQLHQKFNLTDERIFFKIAQGLFCGVGYLNDNNMIHRDIACRNLLVKKDFEVVIADFGLTVRAPNGEYKSSTAELLPWPWIPPETLKSGVFRCASDVWAVGVTLWEVLTKGKVPYADAKGVLPSMKLAAPKISSGELRLEIPSQHLQWAHDILDCCLHPRPEGRLKLSRETWLDFASVRKGALDWNLFTEEEVAKRAAQAVKIEKQDYGEFNELASEIEAITKRIKAWRRSDVRMILSFSRPPLPCKLAMEALCIMLGKKPDWNNAKVLLKGKIAECLITYDRNAIPPKVIKAVKPYVEGEEKAINPDKCRNVSDVVYIVAIWVLAMYKYHFLLKEVGPAVERVERFKKLEELVCMRSGDVNGMWPRVERFSSVQAANFNNGNLHVVRSSIRHLTNLVELHLDSNHLASLPPEIKSLAKLEILSLNQNHCVCLPTEVKFLTNLKKLYLQKCNLTSLPPEVKLLRSLKKLYLQKNQLASLPSDINALVNLEKVYLENNKLTNLPSSIKSFTKLQWLRAEENRLTSIPPEIGCLTSLEVLNLDSNQLTSLPLEVESLSNLRELSIANNQLTSFPSETLSLTKLHLLSLDGNQLTSLPPGIKSLKNLTKLYLDKNQLISLPPELGSLDCLEHLSLSGNPRSPDELRQALADGDNDDD